MATWGDQTCQRFEVTAVGFETGFSRLRVRPSNRYAIAPHKGDTCSVQALSYTVRRYLLCSGSALSYTVRRYLLWCGSILHSQKILALFRLCLIQSGEMCYVLALSGNVRRYLFCVGSVLHSQETLVLC